MKWLRQASARVVLETEAILKYNLSSSEVHDKCYPIAKGNLPEEEKIQAIDGILKEMATALENEPSNGIQYKSTSGFKYNEYSDTPDQVLQKL